MVRARGGLCPSSATSPTTKSAQEARHVEASSLWCGARQQTTASARLAMCSRSEGTTVEAKRTGRKTWTHRVRGVQVAREHVVRALDELLAPRVALLGRLALPGGAAQLGQRRDVRGGGGWGQREGQQRLRSRAKRALLRSNGGSLWTTELATADHEAKRGAPLSLLDQPAAHLREVLGESLCVLRLEALGRVADDPQQRGALLAARRLPRRLERRPAARQELPAGGGGVARRHLRTRSPGRRVPSRAA